jgi:ATP-dependent DNA helicase DinG
MVEAADTLSRVLKADAGLVRWLDASPGRDGSPTVRLNLAPVDVAKIVRELLQGESRSVVATSATLSVEGGFAHFRGRIGLGPGEAGTEALLEESIPSPFDYGRQVLLGIASELPEPDRPGYDDAIAVAVAEAVRIASGRTFVLLTSYAHLRRCADSVGRLLGERFQVLRQGDLPREQLLSAFRAASQAVLFGTDSFWEGVDVRGEALSCVILPRLPFRVPTEPVQVARAEAVEREGRDPFKVLSIPQAVLKFRQGFGRLIRHREDRGVVLVLDSRIASRWYGRAFLRSLPEEIEPVRGEIPFILDKMQTFFHVNREGIPDAG